tara:strand:+ start:172 stop:1581 length:1410 start_codon:yes stop_codon:yes gene_type:complete
MASATAFLCGAAIGAVLTWLWSWWTSLSRNVSAGLRAHAAQPLLDCEAQQVAGSDSGGAVCEEVCEESCQKVRALRHFESGSESSVLSSFSERLRTWIDELATVNGASRWMRCLPRPRPVVARPAIGCATVAYPAIADEPNRKDLDQLPNGLTLAAPDVSLSRSTTLTRYEPTLASSSSTTLTRYDPTLISRSISGSISGSISQSISRFISRPISRSLSASIGYEPLASIADRCSLARSTALLEACLASEADDVFPGALAAAGCVFCEIIEKLGPFMVITREVRGNLRWIESAAAEHRCRHSLRAVLLGELASGLHSQPPIGSKGRACRLGKGPSAALGLIWLIRFLELWIDVLQISWEMRGGGLFVRIAGDRFAAHRSAQRSVRQRFEAAYKQKLLRYNGWATQAAFWAAMTALPSTIPFLDHVDERFAKEDQFEQALKDWTRSLSELLRRLAQIRDQLNLNDPRKSP